MGLSLAFFGSPAKAYLVGQLKARQGSGREPLSRSTSHDTSGHPLLGLPSDPGKEIDEAVQEIREEIENRRRRGSTVNMPQGLDLQAEVRRRLVGSSEKIE